MRLRPLTVVFKRYLQCLLEHIRFPFNCLGSTQPQVSPPFKYFLSRYLSYLYHLIIKLRRHETVLLFKGSFNQFQS